eukprot:403354597
MKNIERALKKQLDPLSGENLEKVPVSDSAARQIYNNKQSAHKEIKNEGGGTILNQIKLQSAKKGQKIYRIDSEEDVEWFLKNYVEPLKRKKEVIKNQQRIRELEESGDIPKGFKNQIAFFNKKNQQQTQKTLDDQQYFGKQIEGIEKDEVLLYKDVELENLSFEDLEKRLKELDRIVPKDKPMNEIDKLLNSEEGNFDEDIQLMREIEMLEKSGQIEKFLFKDENDDLTKLKLEGESLSLLEQPDEREEPKIEKVVEQDKQVRLFSELIQKQEPSQGQPINYTNDLIHDIKSNRQMPLIQNIHLQEHNPQTNTNENNTNVQDQEQKNIKKNDSEKQRKPEEKSLINSKQQEAEDNRISRKQKKESNLQIIQDKEQSNQIQGDQDQSIQPQMKQQKEENLPQIKNKKQEKLLDLYATGDQRLNSHIFGNIPLKEIDFRSPEVYKMFRVKKPKEKKEIFNYQMDKLNVLIHFYTKEDFDNVKFFKLNADQILVFLGNPNFTHGLCKKEKVVEALHFLHKLRQLKLFQERPEVKQLIKDYALDHELLRSFKPQSYVTSFVYSVMKMKFEDPQVWSSLASYIAQNYKLFDLRNISNIVYALHKVSVDKPIILNFDDLFTQLELPIIMKLDKGEGDPQSIANTILSYTKCQNGSVQFYQAMEKHIIAYKDKFNSMEIANILYSYQKSKECSKEILKDLEDTTINLMSVSQPKELVMMLMAYTETNLMNPRLLRCFENEFKSKHEDMNAEDISKYYYCFTKVGHEFKAEGRFYKYLQKTASKLIMNFEGPHLRHMFYKFDDKENIRLNEGVKGRLMDRVQQLITKDQIKGYDLNEIYNNTLQLPPNQEGKSRHDFNYKCMKHLEKMKYFV